MRGTGVDAETFAEWLRRQGHRVVRTPSSWWYEAGPRVYQAFPYHWLLPVDSGHEVRELLLRHGILAVRYSTTLEAPEGKASYHVVLHRPYTLEGLPGRARNGVRRGLGRFRIEQVPFERLAREGWDLQRDTLERQGRLRSMDQGEWERLCRAAVGLRGFEAWAALAPNGDLAAALITARVGDTWCVPWALSHSGHLRDHVNNALFYAVSADLLGREGVRGLFFTLQSLDAPESVDEFKFRMGLEPVAVRQRVDFHPAARPFAHPRVHGLVAGQLARHPDNPTLAKAEGILRFHVEGRRPLDEQEWPSCLAGVPRLVDDGDPAPRTSLDIPPRKEAHT